MKLKSNKGSSMLLVVILVAVLLTLCGAMISVINVNYKAKTKEANRIKNLYEAEAGLDVAYNIIVKAFEASVQAGNAGVSESENIIQKRIENNKEEFSEEEIETMKDKAFKESFRKYLEQVDNIKTDETYKVENSVLEDCINYIWNNGTDISNENIIYKYVTYNSENESNKDFKAINIETKKGISKPKLKCKNMSFDTIKGVYTFDIYSQFETESSTGVNKRELQVTYSITVPDYEGASSSDSNISIDVPSEIDTNVITIDGNMNINGNNSSDKFTINGNVFVKGNESDNSTKNDIVYNKYKGGIQITGSQAKVEIAGDVVTTKTFNINSQNSYVKIDNTLYAGNVYIGNKDGTHSGKSDIQLNSVVTDNDFVVKSNGSSINIENFYGINDKNLNNYNSTTNNDEDKTSSSIIVNNDRNISSTLTINEEAYIMGTAYVNAQNNGKYYQTGESVAIKGNYIAYTKPLSDFNNYEFNTYGLLQMVDKKNNQSLDAISKSEYFAEFVQQADENEISDGGVTLNREKTYAAGAVVYKDSDENLVVERSNYTKSTDEKVLEKRNEYATEVCMMGNLDNKNSTEVYNNQSSNQKTVASSIINFSNDNKLIKTNESGQVLILNNNADKTIIISDKDGSSTNIKEWIKVDNEEINALIISKGNIILDGDFTFNGAIIGAGDLDILNRSKNNIVYNKDVVNNIVNTNYAHLNGVFRNTSSQINIETTIESTDTVTYTYQYDTKKYIKSENWKIRKNGQD